MKKVLMMLAMAGVLMTAGLQLATAAPATSGDVCLDEYDYCRLVLQLPAPICLSKFYWPCVDGR